MVKFSWVWNHCSSFSQCLSVASWHWKRLQELNLKSLFCLKLLIIFIYINGEFEIPAISDIRMLQGSLKTGNWTFQFQFEINVFEKCQNKFKLSKFGKWDYDRWKVVIHVWNSPALCTRLKLKKVRLVISESMSGCIKLICFGLKYIRMRQMICQIVPRECIRKYHP